MRFAVITSRFNSDVTDGLLAGARAYFEEQGFDRHALDLFEAPGAFELPLLAQKLARTGRYTGIVCLGAVIKGETAHFELISLAAATGILQASLSTGVPISFGVLTAYSDSQAEARAGAGAGNKGREAAAACLETARQLALIS